MQTGSCGLALTGLIWESDSLSGTENSPQRSSSAADSAGPVSSSDIIAGELLEHVIAATATSAAGELLKPTGDVAIRLTTVARRYPGQQLCTVPVIESLVDAVTSDIPFLSAEQRTTMNRTVAHTLYADVDTRSRVERLWNSLRQNP